MAARASGGRCGQRLLLQLPGCGGFGARAGVDQFLDHQFAIAIRQQRAIGVQDGADGLDLCVGDTWLFCDDLGAPLRAAAVSAGVAVGIAGMAFGPTRALRLHGDVHPGNVLWIDSGEMRGPHFVDFDDARTGPAMQDLWMLISGDRESMEHQLARVLEGYERFRAFDRRELHLVEALRTLRLLHYSAWIAQRWDDPAFPAAFPWFGTTRYWQDRILELREQIGAMDETPLVVV